MKCLLILLNLLYFISNVASLVIVVQPQTIVGSPTLVAWSREDSDAASQDLIFDLRFVQAGADVGLAKANIVPSDAGSDSGTVLVNFPSQGNYVLKAVSGSCSKAKAIRQLRSPRNTVIGTSGRIQAVQLTPSSSSSSISSSATTINPPPSISTASPSSPSSSNSPPSSSTSSTSQPTASSPSKLNSLKKNPNLPAIVGGAIGGLLLLALLAFIFVLVSRRRKAFQKRLTFHKDMMVQRRFPFSNPASLPINVSSETVSDATSNADIAQPSRAHGGGTSTAAPPDVEQGLGGNEGSGGEDTGLPITPGRSLGTGHIVPSPKGPRPSIKRTEQTIVTPRLPPDPQPLRTQRQRDLADRITMLNGQMLDVQNLHYHERRHDVDAQTEGSRSPDSARVRVLDDMQREMLWLRDQEYSPWALGLTDVLPPGHARYMTP